MTRLSKAIPATALLAAMVFLSPGGANASGLPVTASRPRLFLSPSVKARLLERVAANDPAWLALKARADVLAGRSIYPYTYGSHGNEPNGTIPYSYQGSNWYDAAFTLGLAFQMTGNAAYSAKLVQLADELLRAQAAPANNPPQGLPPLRVDSYYPTRFVCPTAAVIYDWCYDALGASRRAQLVTLMLAYFDDLRPNAYERADGADGNYYGGHVLGTTLMGLALSGDTSRAQELVDWGRARIDGSTSPLVVGADFPKTWISQTFEGGYPAEIARGWQGPNWTGAPMKGGFDHQGWAYGSNHFSRVIDALAAIRSATGEDLFASRSAWFSQMLRAQKHSLMPNRSEIDPIGDWSGGLGATVIPGLAMRLAFALEGQPDGELAQRFARSEIVPYSYPGGGGTAQAPPAWVAFLFDDPDRPQAAEFRQPPFYSGFSPAYPQLGATNGARPYFLARTDWSPSAVWASMVMGAAYWGDHQHGHAGHLALRHAGDYLLVDAAAWKGEPGGSGIVGNNADAPYSSAGNTLYFDDRGDYMHPYYNYSGGQGYWGRDDVAAGEQQAAFTYVRSDLTTAYNRASDPGDVGSRRLIRYVRSVLYLREPGLLLVDDDFATKPPLDAQKPYCKHLRWHLPNVPSVNGASFTLTQGASRLFLETLEPQGALLNVVDESNNPDPCLVGEVGCTPWGYDGGTYRVEVKHPADADTVRFRTVIHPAASGTPAPTSQRVTSNDGKMAGALVTPPVGEPNLALFNVQAGLLPPAVTSTSYPFALAGPATHTLAGMEPGSSYDATLAGGTVTVAKTGGGALQASPGGVLRFVLAGGAGKPAQVGDLDRDGNVDVFDLIVLAGSVVGNVAPGVAPFAASRVTADTNLDGTLDVFDLVLLAGRIVGNVESLPQ